MGRKSEDYESGLISVIIPVYNVEKYIDRTLNSVFAQTYKNFEIILIDDQSSDSSADIIKKYQETHPEIIYYLQSENRGAGYARNKALELAKGQYVAFLDADDMWKPDKLEKQIDFLKEKNGSFCFAAIEMIDGDDNVIKGKRNIKDEVDYNFLLSNTIIPTSGVLIDREIKGDFRMHIRRGGQDYATWLKLLKDGSKAYGMNEALVKYRIDGKSLSSNKLKSIGQIWEIQTQDEEISKLKAAMNICKWVVNSIKKYEISPKELVNIIFMSRKK